MESLYYQISNLINSAIKPMQYWGKDKYVDQNRGYV